MPKIPSEFAATLPCRVLMVAGLPERHALVREVLSRVVPGVRVESADSVVDALLSSMRKPADLLLLDLSVDDAFAPVVVRHLARVAPVTEVMLFDVRARTVPGHQVVRAWDDLDAVLRQWHKNKNKNKTRAADDAGTDAL
jgi:response regulator RpfG family c-di-GMP phosphodiesterase